MDNKELEHLLLENLKIARENREYLIKIDRRQRWQRNFRTFYWIILVGLAVGGYYYAFPYLKEARENISTSFGQFKNFLDFTQAVHD